MSTVVSAPIFTEPYIEGAELGSKSRRTLTERGVMVELELCGHCLAPADSEGFAEAHRPQELELELASGVEAPIPARATFVTPVAVAVDGGRLVRIEFICAGGVVYSVPADLLAELYAGCVQRDGGRTTYRLPWARLRHLPLRLPIGPSPYTVVAHTEGGEGVARLRLRYNFASMRNIGALCAAGLTAFEYATTLRAEVAEGEFTLTRRVFRDAIHIGGNIGAITALKLTVDGQTCFRAADTLEEYRGDAFYHIPVLRTEPAPKLGVGGLRETCTSPVRLKIEGAGFVGHVYADVWNYMMVQPDCLAARYGHTNLVVAE